MTAAILPGVLGTARARPHGKRRSRLAPRVIFVLAALTIAGAAGCGDDDDGLEEDTAAVEEVALAYGASEGADACEFMSASALDQLGGQSGCTREFENVPSAEFEVQEVTVEDGTATASVENVEERNVIKLSFVKEDDEWKISEFPGIEAVGRPPGALLPGPGAENPLLEAPAQPGEGATETAPETGTDGAETETAP